MTKLSVNINKIATLRNARGGDIPNVVQVAKDVQDFGAHGVTVHPRPDERHITYKDVRDLRPVVHTEFNIEGNPYPRFTDLVMEVLPEQVTLVPDAEDAITSNAGWDTVTHRDKLRELIAMYKQAGIRTSIFVDPVPEMIRGAAETGTDRIELYTEAYAKAYANGDKNGVMPYRESAELAHELGLGVNAGHDLSLDNIRYFKEEVPHLKEVSIGHALISESIYLGLENVVNMYIHRLR